MLIYDFQSASLPDAFVWLNEPQDYFFEGGLWLVTKPCQCAPWYRSLFREIFGLPYRPPVHSAGGVRPSHAIASHARWPMSKS